MQMRSKWLGALLSAVVVGMVMPAAALAAKPAATTGTPAKLTYQSVRLRGSVDPNKQNTSYYFQYGTTIAFGAQTPPFPAGNGDKAVRARIDVGGLAPATKYFYRLVAHNNSGTALGKRRSFTTKKQPLGLSLVATPNPVPAKNTATLVKGNLSGTGNAGRRVVLQSSAWRYTLPFQNVSNEQVTDVNGNFAFPLLNGAVTQNTQFRVVMPQRPDIISPIVLLGVKPYVKSKVSKHRVQRGHLVRFSGSITPRAADQQVAFQKKHNGQWVTVGGVTRLRSGGKFSKNVRIRRGGTFRVWTGTSAGQYASNVGKKIKIKTFR
jgi:hypothetical protein